MPINPPETPTNSTIIPFHVSLNPQLSFKSVGLSLKIVQLQQMIPIYLKYNKRRTNTLKILFIQITSTHIKYTTPLLLISVYNIFGLNITIMILKWIQRQQIIITMLTDTNTIFKFNPMCLYPAVWFQPHMRKFT